MVTCIDHAHWSGEAITPDCQATLLLQPFLVPFTLYTVLCSSAAQIWANNTEGS